MYGYLGWALLVAFLLSLVLWIGRAASHRQIKSSWVYCALGITLWLLYPSGIGTGSAVASTFTELAILQLAVATLDVIILRRFNAPKFVGEVLIAGGYVAVLFTLLANVGLSITGLITTSAVATAILGLSLQDMLVNFVGGVVLELEHTIKVGDWIRTEQVSGAVTAVSLRHTVVQTADNDTVLLPNSSLIRLPVTIVSRKHRRIIPFHLPYGCNPANVIEAVELALTLSPINGTCAEPRPRCVISDYHPSHVSFAVLAWLSEPSKEVLAVSTVLMRIHFALARHGQPLTSISQTVDLNQIDKPQDSSAQINKYVEILRSTPIFHALPEEATRRLAPSVGHAVYAPGEYIVRQGDESGSMYIVIHGSVDIHVDGEGGMSEYVATLEAGKFFGELSLFTGETRTANVIAMTAVECLVIDKPSLTELFDWHPELAVDISEVITERQAGLAATLERLDGEQKRVLAARSRVDMLRRIQRYFGIGESDTVVPR